MTDQKPSLKDLGITLIMVDPVYASPRGRGGEEYEVRRNRDVIGRIFKLGQDYPGETSRWSYALWHPVRREWVSAPGLDAARQGNGRVGAPERSKRAAVDRLMYAEGKRVEVETREIERGQRISFLDSMGETFYGDVVTTDAKTFEIRTVGGSREIFDRSQVRNVKVLSR